MGARSVHRAQVLLATLRLREATPDPVGLPDGHGILETLVTDGADAADGLRPDLSPLSLFLSFSDIGGEEQM